MLLIVATGLILVHCVFVVELLPVNALRDSYVGVVV